MSTDTDGRQRVFDHLAKEKIWRAVESVKSLREPEVTEQLRLIGFVDTQDVGMVWFPADGETFQDASRRAPQNGRRVLLVWPDVECPGGWAMRWAEQVSQ